jgi:uronate dehydrogenase
MSVTNSSESLTALRFRRLLLTGAAGALGRELRPRLKKYCETLRVSDVAEMDAAGPGEEVIPVALEDRGAMRQLLEGVDAVVHLGGVSVETPFDPILAANILGVYNLYEAARRNGVKRIVFASSNHVTGFYRQDEVVSPLDPVRPDTMYGVSKAFGENISRMYFDRFGIQTACLRIGSALAAPKDRRMLASWLSFDDLERLVVACLSTAMLGHTIVYGMSDNRVSWWDNTPARHLGYVPQDSSERFRAELEARQPELDPRDPVVIHQGGAFVRAGPFD